MTLKQYSITRIIVVILLSASFSWTYANKNLPLGLSLLLVASLVLMFLRKQVKEIMLDEMSYALGGKAALAAMQIFCWLTVIAMLATNAVKTVNPMYGGVSNILAFSACLLMLIYSACYRFFAKESWMDLNFIFTLLLVLLFCGFFIFSVFVKPL